MKQNRPHLEKGENRFYGHNACIALWQNRPQDMIRVYIRKDIAEHYEPLLTDCSRLKKSYHLVAEQDLERLTDSVHHQGICIVAKERRLLSENLMFQRLNAKRTLLLFIDGVKNPHNLGAMMRTAAHFGLPYLLCQAGDIVRISPSANRTSEGGAECVELVEINDVEKTFSRLKNMGFGIFGLEPGEKKQTLFNTRLPERLVFVMGSEVSGLSDKMKAMLDASIEIPGTGAVESINVSVAAALAMYEFQRQGAERSVRIVREKT